MKPVIENQMIEKLTRFLPRSPRQANGLQQSDAEILRLGEQGPLLALTLDSIAEEIEAGLYRDPFLMGWMVVLVNASDLAAVGADPLAILINETLSSASDDRFLKALQQGIARACRACGLSVLGGDTNFAAHTELSACAVGLLPENTFVARTGCQPGDLLYATGKLGAGNAFAFEQLNGLPPSFDYRPRPHFARSKIIRSFATCCMDTSDGFLATLDQLMRLNGLGFALQKEPTAYLHEHALQLCARMQLPLTAPLAGPHGEFELIFTVPAKHRQQFSEQARALNWQPVFLGTVLERQELHLPLNGRLCHPDTALIRNLFDRSRGDVRTYTERLLSYLKKLEKGEGN